MDRVDGAHQGDGSARAGPELYTYEAEQLVYAMNWSVRPDKPLRLAVASFLEDTKNYVTVVQVDEEKGTLGPVPNLTFRHDYPPTKLMFIPDKDGSRPDMMVLSNQSDVPKFLSDQTDQPSTVFEATTGEFLRLWAIQEDGVRLERVLTHSKSSQFCAPLTSFDWNEIDTRRLGVASIDTTCTIWDVERGVVDTQLIAHDKEVYDICWGGPAVFGTVSADGSVRVFDLRDKHHSTIIYETQDGVPLLRLAWNKLDPWYLATIALDSSTTIIIDIRYPSVPSAELRRHSAPVNCVAWAPHSASYICSAGDDSEVLVWELAAGNKLGKGPNAVARNLEPILAYKAEAEINQLHWSATQTEWLGICFNNKLQILRI